MPATLDDDGSEDVNDFLQRIRELGDQRDKEDEERNRKLEEEIIQGRKERQARRAGLRKLERARSLSPTKETPSNAGTPGSVRSRNDSVLLDDLSKTPSLPPPSPQSLSIVNAPRKMNAILAKQEVQENGEGSPEKSDGKVAWLERPLLVQANAGEGSGLRSLQKKSGRGRTGYEFWKRRHRSTRNVKRDYDRARKQEEPTFGQRPLCITINRRVIPWHVWCWV
ncbi:MAG: hypothetical protein Q9164_002467 [Protoblastenia rupestris]